MCSPLHAIGSLPNFRGSFQTMVLFQLAHSFWKTWAILETNYSIVCSLIAVIREDKLLNSL
jgi:hypothetical protein